MAKEVLMPKLSSTMDVGYVTEWFVKEGDYVKVGDRLFEVMTDKIAIEVESYDEGFILKRYVDVNEEVPVNSVIAYIGEEDEEVPESIDYASDKPLEEPEVEKEVVSEVEVETSVQQSQVLTAPHEVDDGRVRATPSARRLAQDYNLNLKQIKGSGRGGRIQAKDVEIAKNIPASVQEQAEFVPFRGIRKAVADKMSYSASTIPHVTLFAKTDVVEIMKLRTQLKTNDINVSITDIVLYIVSRVVKRYPYLNATTTKEGILLHPYVNLGVAVALDDGLVVPVIKRADRLSLKQISEKRIELMNRALEGRLSPSDMTEGTFTVSSIGRGTVEGFTPIINAPEAGILGVGTIVDGFKVVQDEIIATKELTYSLSFDHRVIDGYPASLFMNDLIKFTENPYMLLI